MNRIEKLTIIVFFFIMCVSCSKEGSGSKSYLLAEDSVNAVESVDLSLNQVARIFAALPIGKEQMGEVHRAACSSLNNGYDEEYTMRKLFESPGSGLGEESSKAPVFYSKPLRDMLSEYLLSEWGTKASEDEVLKYLDDLASSDLQIYWPYSESWDASSLPIITFDPGYNTDYNVGYSLGVDANGNRRVDSLYVYEETAKNRPVWVLNKNADAAYTPLKRFVPSTSLSDGEVKSGNRVLKLKSFKMLRNYDSWFNGASEFFIKCGSVNGFNASTEAELKLFSPSVTDFLVVIKRKYLNVTQEYNAIILTNFTNQIDNLAFLITEDDGGTRTSWKCSATVKVKSKSYGFDVELPYNEKDDIVWRGQLNASFFQSADIVEGRFGDVVLSFALE